MLKWKLIADDYLSYLRNNHESRIPYSDYGKDKFKPFFGELFSVGDLVYVTQVSSPKPRHNSMKENIDFRKIIYQGRLVAVVNLNYMFPVPKNETENLEYSHIDKVRDFIDETQKSKYIDLLQTELDIIRTMDLENLALTVYNKRLSNPDSPLAKRCFDFVSLEKAANQYYNI